MAKTYFNNAVVGNSSMLGCLSDKGGLVRLFWPNIDYPQHIEKMDTGIFLAGQTHSTIWLDSESFQHSQHYIGDTNILETVHVNIEKGMRIVQADYVLPDKDILVRNYEIENFGSYEMELAFILYSASISTTPELASTLFDFGSDSLIHYKHGYYISISGDREAYQFQLGNNAYDSAKLTILNGYDSIGMMPDGAVSWKLGKFKPGEKKQFTIYICASDTLKGVKKLLNGIKEADITDQYNITEKYWTDFVKSARQINTGKYEIDNLYKRSLLVFKLMADGKTGGLLAAPEIDENFTKCGRYAYCWGRDAAFITNALDRCGFTDVVGKFYEWAIDVQDDDGSWQQRYHMDGNLAPSWGMQIDETGTLIWGMLQHYERTSDKEFLVKAWESVKKGVEFLLTFIDDETGLPKPSYDLWEERVGEHTYSSAAVYGGISAGVEIAGILGMPEEVINEWKDAAAGVKAAIEKRLWKEEHGCFIRSVRTKLNPWGSEHSEHTTIIKVNPKEYYRDVTLEDWMVDVSLLGVSIPFEVLDAKDYRMESTVEKIENVLTAHHVGGIRRYENDNYIGGNPWILTTLWVALYHIKQKNFAKAKAYLEWAVKGRTDLNLLPEQINKNDGTPAWVIPLTWSHAMFVLVLLDLADAGEI